MSFTCTNPPAWPTLQTAFTTQKDFGKEAREAQWALAQRTLHGLHPPESKDESSSAAGGGNRELGFMAEQAKRRAEIARYTDQSLRFLQVVSNDL